MRSASRVVVALFVVSAAMVVTLLRLEQGVEPNVATAYRFVFQRLGRILRRSGDKQASLYELVVRDSGEAAISKRRRDHDAYR